MNKHTHTHIIFQIRTTFAVSHNCQSFVSFTAITANSTTSYERTLILSSFGLFRYHSNFLNILNFTLFGLFRKTEHIGSDENSENSNDNDNNNDDRCCIVAVTTSFSVGDFKTLTYCTLILSEKIVVL